MIPVYALHPDVTPEHLGAIPEFLNADDQRTAAQQFNANYAFGGGWHPFKGFELRADNSLKYPGDPLMKPIALMKLREEQIYVYDCAWVCIIQTDRQFEVCRMD